MLLKLQKVPVGMTDGPVTEISHQPECYDLHGSFKYEHGREEEVEDLQRKL